MANVTNAECESEERRAYLFCRERFDSLIKGPGGTRMLREWLEECGEALQSPPYQPEMLAAERVYIDILVDRASNIHPVKLSDRAYQIIKKCSRVPYSGAQICNMMSICEYILEQVCRDQKKIKEYLPQGDVGCLRFEVHFHCKEEFSGSPLDYQAYFDPYLMDKRARWVEILTGHDFRINWETLLGGPR